MSKAVISEKAEPRELKALFIVGLDMRPNPKILEIYDQENCLVIGDGKSPIKITDVEELLDKHNLRISPNTRIDICAHGRRVEEEHTLNLENKKIKTKDFLQQLQNLSPQNPLYINIWACHGGTANKDVEILNPGSIIVTHIESKYIALNITEDFSLLTSITRYMREDNLSPHLQYLYDQLENYQATTFNQIEDNGHIMKFKSIRNLEPDSSANIILNSLQQKNISEELIKKLQNYQALEAKRFHEVLKDYVSFTDIEQFQNHISNISDLDVKNYITGTVMNLITVTTYKDMKVNDEVADIRDNILNNLNPELVNHSILNITPLYVAVAPSS